MQHAIDVGQENARRRIAVLARAGAQPTLVWFGGFRSDMRATKADALDRWAAESGRSFVRFDYSGHGESSGLSEEGTISRWLEDSRAVLDSFARDRPILIGSSMGAWLALLASISLAAESPHSAPAALILLAPATDFTEALMWNSFSPTARESIETTGRFERPSAYGEPYTITRGLIEDGRKHLLLGGPIAPGCPVHIIQGMKDPDVPWEHALKLVDRLPGENVQLTLVKDGDHRLSRPEDIDRLIRVVEATCEAVSTTTESAEASSG
jgi:pimeloyl-ACP methyl ester carboxylesterase